MIIYLRMSRRFDIISTVSTHLFKLPALALLSALLGGCFSLETSPIGGDTAEGLRLRATNGTPVEHVVVANNGWFLFNLWPVACGNSAVGARFPWTFFRDEVHERNLQQRLTKYAAERGCDIEELNVFNDEQVLLSIPGSSFPIPIPYIATYREVQYSGVLVKRPRPRPLSPAEAKRKAITREMRTLLDEIPDGDSK